MIILYTTHCPQCRTLEMKLNKAGIEYEVCEDMNYMNQRGFQAAPMLETPDGTFNFSQAVKWVNAQK